LLSELFLYVKREKYVFVPEVSQKIANGPSSKLCHRLVLILSKSVVLVLQLG